MPSASSRRKSEADIRDLVGERVLVCDGAMGTMLQAAGISLDLSLPELSVSRPELVSAIHGAYIAAGADIIETNTFGACRTRLGRHGLETRVQEINAAGVRAARAAVDASSRSVLIAGSVSPATPPSSRGRISVAVLREAFREQIEALAEAGVDLISLETFGSLEELAEAIAAAREVDPALPVIAQMTFLDDGRTLAGESPSEVAAQLDRSSLLAVGANCTLGPQGIQAVLQEMSRHSSLPLVAQANAGSPTFVDGRFQYTADPAYFARYATLHAETGAVIVGGCCGTTPAHVEAMVAAVKGLHPVAHRRVRSTVGATSQRQSDGAEASSSTLMSRLQSDKFVLVAELSPPTGGTADQAVRDAARLRDLGCDAILIAPPTSPRAQVSSTSLAVLVQQRVEGMETVLTVATWEKSAMALQADLLGAHAFDVKHVLCRTGTPPLLGDYPNVGGIWDVDSVELIQLLRGLNEGRDRQGLPLARPTSFVIGARINPSADDVEREIEDARRKIDAGVDFLITPPQFEVESLERLMDAIGVPLELPVLLGVMPLRDVDHAEYLEHEVPGVSVPPAVLARMHAAGSAPAEVAMQIARELIEAARAHGRIRGAVISSSSNAVDEIAAVAREVLR